MTVPLYRNRLLIRYGNFMFRYRNTVFPIGLVVLVAAFPPIFLTGADPLDLWLEGAAMLIALMGQALRVLTVGLEYIKRGGLNKKVYADRLVTNGLFAHCRNPLYFGNLMIAFALLTIADRPEMLLIGGGLIALTYIAIVAAEEEYLSAAFGEAYEEYCRTTNRWLPDLRGLGGTVRSMRFNWRRVLLKESSSFYGWIVAAFLLDGIENRFSLVPWDFKVFFFLFVAATIAFATIRVLKRAQVLQL